jgi:hypothetical protein
MYFIYFYWIYSYVCTVLHSGIQYCTVQPSYRTLLNTIGNLRAFSPMFMKRRKNLPHSFQRTMPRAIPRLEILKYRITHFFLSLHCNFCRKLHKQVSQLSSVHIIARIQYLKMSELPPRFLKWKH